jgi:uncharacterized protein (TIGR02646 family)
VKKLDRTLASEPGCLTRFSHPTHDWDNVESSHKTEVWLELAKFQDGLCAYCESPASLGQGFGHTEHFFHKGKKADGTAPYAHLTFSWDNLFGCCDSNQHCGHFKDRILPGGVPRPYDPEKLIKPDVDDPETFLQFLHSGKVEPKAGITPDRAIETINTLNLQYSALVDARYGQIKRFENRLLALDSQCEELASNGENVDAVYDQEYADIEAEAMTVAHRTAIKQALF